MGFSTGVRSTTPGCSFSLQAVAPGTRTTAATIIPTNLFISNTSLGGPLEQVGVHLVHAAEGVMPEETITEVVTYANLQYEEKIEVLEAIVKSATELLADIKENPHLHTKPSVIIVDKMNSLDNDFDDAIADQIAVQDDLDSLFEETPPKKK